MQQIIGAANALGTTPKLSQPREILVTTGDLAVVWLPIGGGPAREKTCEQM